MVALPASDEHGAMAKVVARLLELGLSPSYERKGLGGECRLMDGTEVVVAADPVACGDLPIQTTMTVRGRTVIVDALGMAAVRLDKDGSPEALAAGGLVPPWVSWTRN